MKIRRYVGQDINEAMLKVKLDLGDKAVIVNTGTIKYPGFFGFFKRPQIEVLAILDENIESEEVAIEKNYYEVSDIEKEQSYNKTEEMKEKANEAKKNVEELQITRNSSIEEGKCQITETIKYEKNKVWQEIENEEQLGDEEIQTLQEKLVEMESLINDGEHYESIENVNITCEEYKPYQIFTNSLLKNEVEPKVIKQIIDNMDENATENVSLAELALKVNESIKNFLGDVEGIQFKKGEKAKVILFAGPTGVGKTTTIAKMASDFVLKKKKSVGLITADTFRIAAVEQLKTYANILNIPLKIIYSPDEVKNAIREFSDKDVILIDTAGRNHKNKEQFKILKDIVNKANPSESYLLISASTGIKDCKDIIDSYRFLPNNKILFTKLDETSSYGIILNVKSMTENPLSYITTGQDVPEDIEQINVEKITKILLGSNVNG